jgi:Mlc titration factor MtfA (ptsG expression regulator)
MLLNLQHDYFPQVQSILVYPTAYHDPRPKVDRIGIHHLGEDRLGEAHHRGAVVLSWEQVLADSHRPGRGTHLVIHEFAHQLDMENGDCDGFPPLAGRGQRDRWRSVMRREHKQLKDDLRFSRPR